MDKNVTEADIVDILRSLPSGIVLDRRGVVKEHAERPELLASRREDDRQLFTSLKNDVILNAKSFSVELVQRCVRIIPRILKIMDYVQVSTIADEGGLYSYGFKHIIEKFTSTYISNGECIMAMMLLGYQCRFDDINATFNLVENPANKRNKRRLVKRKASSSPSSLPQLPVEILSMAFQYLPKNHLKNARHVSHTWQNAVLSEIRRRTKQHLTKVGDIFNVWIRLEGLKYFDTRSWHKVLLRNSSESRKELLDGVLATGTAKIQILQLDTPVPSRRGIRTKCRVQFTLTRIPNDSRDNDLCIFRDPHINRFFRKKLTYEADAVVVNTHAGCWIRIIFKGELYNFSHNFTLYMGEQRVDAEKKVCDMIEKYVF